MTRTAFLVSPHLDDAAFSCGGIAASLARAGWRVVIATVFTRSVHPATGFALACQRDKGLADSVDYMALRRAEDADAAASLDASFVHLDLPEAPHRGYDSARDLFGAPRAGDAVAPVTAALARAVASFAPALVLAPLGCGAHVDHIRTIDAVLALDTRAVALGFYRDTPYVIRDPDARPDPRLAAAAPHVVTSRLDPCALAAKQEAACCYRTQIGFQFGGAQAARDALATLARREAADDGHAERLHVRDPSLAELIAA